VGTIEPRKNLSRLVEALSRLRRDDPHLGLVVVGAKGWLYEQFFTRVEELGLQEAVLLPGYVPDEDLPAVFRAATVYVMASLYEGAGLPVLEAMACGAPVVTSRQAVSALQTTEGRDLLVAGDSADFARQILSLLEAPERRYALGMAGRRYVEQRHAWPQIVGNLVQLYGGLIQARLSSPARAVPVFAL